MPEGEGRQTIGVALRTHLLIFDPVVQEPPDICEPSLVAHVTGTSQHKAVSSEQG